MCAYQTAGLILEGYGSRVEPSEGTVTVEDLILAILLEHIAILTLNVP